METKYDLDAMENAAFVEGIDEVEKANNGRIHEYIVNYRQWIDGKGEKSYDTPEEGKGSLRSNAGYYGDRSDFAKVVHTVANNTAIQYFNALAEYIKLKESGDGDIDAVRGKVAAFASLTLRQIEGVVKENDLKEARNYTWARSSYSDEVEDLFDFRELRKSDFPTLFDSRGNHFGFSYDGKTNLFCTHNAYSGVGEIDILKGLNPDKDMQIRWMQEGPGISEGDKRLVATLRKDGTLDII